MASRNIASSFQQLNSQSISSYNISFNLTAIASNIFTLPSRLIARIRKTDELLDQSLESLAKQPFTISGIEKAAASAAESTSIAARAPGVAEQVQQTVSAWNFFTSGYAIGLFVMGALVTRIPNLVVPPRPTSRRHTPHNHNNLRHIQFQLLRELYASILPINISRTRTRLILFLPTLFLMLRSLLLWTVVLLQISDLYPNMSSGYIHDLGNWAARKQVSELGWTTFCSICSAFCMDAFVKGMEGARWNLAAHSPLHSSVFNLVPYSFLLHIYSSPITHVVIRPGYPSRPDKHIVITLIIPLLQLTLFHILAVRKRWSTNRLLPTALTSFLTLLHFHITLMSHTKWASGLWPFSLYTSPTPTSTAAAQGAVPRLYSSATGTRTFPVLNYSSNLIETLLILIITLTILLNSLTQLLLTGSISRPFLGLGLVSADGTSTGRWGWSPPWEEDFTVLLLRVGIASLEATRLRGLGNEVGEVVASLPEPLFASHSVNANGSQKQKHKHIEYGSVQMDRSGTVRVTPGSLTTYRVGRGGSRPDVKRHTLRGWNNEIQDVDVGEDGDGGREFVGIPGVFVINLVRLSETWRFCLSVWGVLKGAVVGLWRWIWRRRRGEKDGGVADGPVGRLEERVGVAIAEKEALLYQRFLRGEDISDDDAEDGESEGGEEEWDRGTDVSDEDVDEEFDAGDEMHGLFVDHATSESSSTALLLSMTNTEHTPLTRRRLKDMTMTRFGNADIASYSIPTTPSTRPRDSSGRADDDSRRNCVICTCEPREVICWPCRCLTMCDDCRENLASRSSASKHRCPCCRRQVEGYSRIFIP